MAIISACLPASMRAPLSGFASVFLFAVSVLLCSLAAPVTAAGDLEGLIICIDPGHGGQGKSRSYTGGFVGPNGLTESKAALDIARLLREELRRDGAEIIMTRTSDKRVTQEGTTAEQELMARLAFAEQRKADLIISIHTSSSKSNAQINVTRVLYHEPHAGLERILAETIGRSVSKQIDTRFSGGTVNTYPVVRDAKIPTILIEVSSISNPLEERKLGRLSHTKAIALAIKRGLLLGKRSAPEALWPKGSSAQKIGAQKTEVPEGQTQSTKRVTTAPTPVPPPAAIQRAEAAPLAKAESSSITITGDDLQPGGYVPTDPNQNDPNRNNLLNYVPFAPILGNPVQGHIDQAWLFGESYAGLPLQTGLCFVVPADTPVKAAARGRVELVIPYDQEVPKGYTRDVAPYRGMVVISHEDIRVGGKPIWTVYARMTTIYAAPGELVGEGEIIGKTGKPYDGSRASRLSAFLFEVRAGANSRLKAVNPSPLVRRPAGAPATGALALRIRDESGRPIEGAEIRGLDKELPRYGYSLTYNMRNNPHPILNENLYIGDLPPGNYTLKVTVNGKMVKRLLPISIRPDEILTGTWHLPVE